MLVGTFLPGLSILRIYEKLHGVCGLQRFLGNPAQISENNAVLYFFCPESLPALRSNVLFADGHVVIVRSYRT